MSFQPSWDSSWDFGAPSFTPFLKEWEIFVSRTDSISLEFLQSSLPFSLSLSVSLWPCTEIISSYTCLSNSLTCVDLTRTLQPGFWDGYCDGFWDCRILDLTRNLPAHKTRWKTVGTFVRDVFYIIVSYILKYIFIYFSTKFVYSVLRVKYNYICMYVVLYMEICKVLGFKTF